MAVAAMLFFPAIANSRFHSRIVACQSNLQTISRGLENFSDNHQGQFIPIPVEGKLAIAGVFGPTLRDQQYVTDEAAFFCAGDVASRPESDTGAPLPELHIPALGQIVQAEGAELRRLQRMAGGSYGYNLGFMLDGRYSPVRNQRRPTFAMVADAPGPQRQGRLSMHHEGRGQNVLFEDGHIEFVAGGRVLDFDEIFYSDRGFVEAGQHPDDAVIGNSNSRPILWTPQIPAP
jgi:hypothetical protein